MATGRDDGIGTAARILDVAERLVQIRGFNAFSYADVAAELKITKAALYYHFAGKAELGESIVARYSARFALALSAADAEEATAPAKLERYAALYLDVLRDRKMCLCGMLAAEYQTLPAAMQEAVIRFFDQNEIWLEHVLEEGRREGSLQFAGLARDTARTIVSSFEGAMLIARSYSDVVRFQTTAAKLLSGLVRDGESALMPNVNLPVAQRAE